MNSETPNVNRLQQLLLNSNKSVIKKLPTKAKGLKAPALKQFLNTTNDLKSELVGDDDVETRSIAFELDYKDKNALKVFNRVENKSTALKPGALDQVKAISDLQGSQRSVSQNLTLRKQINANLSTKTKTTIPQITV